MLLVCYVLLYVVALCAKMRYAILCIKQLLIDWLLAASSPGSEESAIPQWSALNRTVSHCAVKVSFKSV